MLFLWRAVRNAAAVIAIDSVGSGVGAAITMAVVGEAKFLAGCLDRPSAS